MARSQLYTISQDLIRKHSDPAMSTPLLTSALSMLMSKADVTHRWKKIRDGDTNFLCSESFTIWHILGRAKNRGKLIIVSVMESRPTEEALSVGRY